MLYHTLLGYENPAIDCEENPKEKWYHYTDNSISRMYLRSNSNSQLGIKPEGVWFCRNDEWSKWCQRNQFLPKVGLKNKYQLTQSSFGINIFQFEHLGDLMCLDFCIVTEFGPVFDWTKFTELTRCQGVYFNINTMCELLRKYEDECNTSIYFHLFRKVFKSLINMLDIDSLVLWDINNTYLSLCTEKTDIKSKKALKRKKSRMNNSVVQEKRRKRDATRRHQKRIRRREKEKQRKHL